jgi:hypothetical protein
MELLAQDGRKVQDPARRRDVYGFRKNIAKLTVLAEQQEYITSLENFDQILKRPARERFKGQKLIVGHLVCDGPVVDGSGGCTQHPKFEIIFAD